ncbi:uncharacterized mitochondrial protein AtMg00810-like [Andrographis paniculata]|uniref:uncharacterized mitochondrial protein AtMg00810-like n=1 Tax=Andrographis paniculata TaxID=175694 RepID=UPI0021E7DC9D|nr:uncharacterized mitochondrial protein AtMg00810-like [Andrographis paniculata]
MILHERSLDVLVKLDVKNAFLHGDLFEDMYMSPPPGFPTFSKSLGPLRYFLSLEISDTSDGYFFSQAKYVSNLLSRAGLTNSKTEPTPLDSDCRITLMDGVPLDDPTLYRQPVGSLIYLTVTRPDTAYVVHILSQFMSAPRTTHYSAVLRILRYVKDTLLHGLNYSARSSLVLTGYSDADWKQTVISRSSEESKYRALVDTTAELLWLRWLLADLGVSQHSASTIHCDTQSAMKISTNDVFHEPSFTRPLSVILEKTQAGFSHSHLGFKGGC